MSLFWPPLTKSRKQIQYEIGKRLKEEIPKVCSCEKCIDVSAETLYEAYLKEFLKSHKKYGTPEHSARIVWTRENSLKEA